MTTPSFLSQSADTSAPADVQLIGQPALRGNAFPADTSQSQVGTLWTLMIKLMDTLNQQAALKYFADRYSADDSQGKNRIGAAIAAPQVNCPVQAFLMYDPNDDYFRFFINPVCTPNSGSTTWNSIREEACLSIPNLMPLEWGNADTKRQTDITVEYYTFFKKNSTKDDTSSPIPLRADTQGTPPDGTFLEKNTFSVKYSPLLPTNTSNILTQSESNNKILNWVTQHEIDHLKGVLFTDYVGLGSDYDNPNDPQAENNARLILYVGQQALAKDKPKYPIEFDQSLAEKEISKTFFKQLSGEQAALIYG